MNQIKKIVFVSLVFILLATSLTPALAAGEASLTIQNKSDGYRYVVLTGPQTVAQMVLSGQSLNVELPTGTYDYSYWGCGLQTSGTLKVKNGANKLIIAACGSQANSTGTGGSSSANNAAAISGTGDEDTGKLIMINNLFQNIRVTFTGASTAYLYIPHGRTQVALPAGDYTLSYISCGLPVNDTTRVVANRTRNYELECENELSVSKQIGRVLVDNRSGQTVRLIITSPIYKEYTISGDKLRIFLPWGEYTFTAIVGEMVINGTIHPSKDKTTLKIFPARYTFTTG